MADLSFEYPKWVHCEGRASVVVDDADEEAAQLAEWAPPKATPNRLVGSHAAVAASVLESTKQRGGWPKGRPRKPAHAVN